MSTPVSRWFAALARPTRPIRRAKPGRHWLELLECRTTPAVTFELQAPAVAVGDFPLGVALGDFNSDGKLDLVATNGSASSVSVAFGNGDGTFAAAVSYPASFNPVRAAVADFNGDSKLDIVVVNDGNNSVSVLLNNGDGTFGGPTPFGTNGIAPRSVAVGDFNGDGKPDIAATNASNSTNFISVFTNTTPTNGTTPSFTRTTIPTGGNGQGVSVGDLDGDTRPDIVNVDFQNNTVSVRLNTTATPGGSPTFGSRVTYATGSVPQLSTLGDFDGDGNLDVAATFSGGVNVLLGQGDGTFGSAATFAVPGNPNDIQVGDFDGDGKFDLVVAGGGGIDVLVGQGDGTFGAPTNYGANGNNFTVAVGNINGDVRPDLVTNNFSANTVSVLLNAGTPSTTTAGSATATFGSADQPVTLTATVVGTGGETVNGGTFTFTVRDALNNVVGTPTVSGTVANGAATAAYTLPGGTPVGVGYTVTAVYNPGTDSFFGTSTDAAGTLAVAPAATTTSPTTAAATFGGADQVVTLTGAVTSPGGPVNDGTLTFTVRDAGNNVVGTAVSGPVTAGTATAAYTLPGGAPAGAYTIETVYTPGSGNLTTSTDTAGTLAVAPAAAPAPVRLTAEGTAVGGGPRVMVRNADGSVRFDFFAFNPAFRGGVTAAVADLNGDGVDDIVTGAGIGGAPHVKVFDGRTGAEVASFFAYDASFRGGVSVGAADENGDGSPDIVTGAGPGGSPHVKAFRFDGLTPIASFFAFDPSFRGGVNVASGDLFGDARAELVLAAGAEGGPVVSVFDGATGRRVSQFFAGPPTDRGGVRVAVTDLDGNGANELIARAAGVTKVYDPLTGADRSSGFTAAQIGGVFVG